MDTERGTKNPGLGRLISCCLLLPASCLLFGVGCNSWPRHNGPVQARVGSDNPTVAQLVRYLNDNSQRVNSLACREVELDCKQGSQGVGLLGRMVCQKPKNFRLTAQVVGKDAVDMGSNDREFWYWVSKAEPPYLFHCSYEDYRRGVQMPFPFRPEWVMEAMGLGQYDPAKNYELKSGPGVIELAEQTVTPQGQPVRKVTVFNRVGSTSNRPQVSAYVLQDSKGKEICSAHVVETQVDSATGAVLPRRIRMVWPEQQVEMKMKLDGITVNGQLDSTRTATLFTRPTLAGVASYDLSRGLDSPVQSAGGTLR